MWQRTTVLCVLARTPPRLSDAGRPKNCSVRNTSINSGGRRTEQTTTTSSTTSAAAALPSSKPAPSSFPPLSSLMQTVEQLKEATRRTQHTLRNQEEALQLLQQKFALMEQQVIQLDTAAEGLRGKLNEVHRVVGEVVMGQRNTDLLIQQMERQQLNPLNTPIAVEDSREDSQRDNKNTQREGVEKTKIDSITENTANALDVSLAPQVAALEARLNQLTLELFGADRLLTSGGLHTSSRSPPSPAAENLAAILSSSGTSAKQAAVMRALQRRYAVGFFTDAAGVTRVTGQCVCVHNVPLNMGAAEVREICVQHVCQDDSDGFVSCVVRRTLDATPSSTTNKNRSNGSLKATTMSNAEGSAEASPVYTSQQQQEKASQVSKSKGEAVEHRSDGFSSAAGAAAHIGSLPRGDTVAAIQPHTKSFEVVFASSALAVRALKVLNGVQLRPTAHAAPLPLAVEPVVSADVLSALRELETAVYSEDQKK